MTFRGGQLPDEHRIGFYADVGKTYRCPAVLASSCSEGAAMNFVHRAQETRVLWSIQVPRNTVNVNELGTMTCCPGEFEYLFPPYTVFRILAAPRWIDDALGGYHRIELEVASDNRDHSETLICAPWW